MSGCFTDLLGNPGMDQDCLAKCETYDACLINGCKKTTAKGGLFFHATPDPDACKHDFQGWVEFDEGRGGTTVCTKCGMDAMTYSLRTGI